MATQIDNVIFDLESGQHNVVRTAGGVLYAILCDAYSATKFIACYKSTDGSSWAEQDSGNRPTDAANQIFRVAIAIDSNDVIHIAYYNRTNTAIRYITFNTGTDQWGTPEIVTTNANALTYTGVSITVDSADKPHIVFNTQIAYHGTPYWQVFYQNKTGASWLGSDERVDNSDQAYSYFPTIEIDSLNNIHVAWLEYDGNTAPQYAYYRKRTSGGVWDTNPTSLGDATAVDVGGPTLAINTDGDILVVWPYDNTNFSIYYNLYSSGSWGGATDTGSDGKWPCVGTDGATDFYIVFRRNSDDDLYYREYDGSMGDETSLETGITVQSPNIKFSYHNNNGAGTQLDYLFKDGTGYIWWNKLSMAAPPVGGKSFGYIF